MDTKDIVEHLRRLSAGEVRPARKMCGVCRELEDMYNVPRMDIARAAIHWPVRDKRLDRRMGGGRYNSFPVPHPTEDNSSYAYLSGYDKWGQDAYGDKRREFCGWLADYIEEHGLPV